MKLSKSLLVLAGISTFFSACAQNNRNAPPQSPKVKKVTELTEEEAAHLFNIKDNFFSAFTKNIAGTRVKFRGTITGFIEVEDENEKKVARVVLNGTYEKINHPKEEFKEGREIRIENSQFKLHRLETKGLAVGADVDWTNQVVQKRGDLKVLKVETPKLVLDGHEIPYEKNKRGEFLQGYAPAVFEAFKKKYLEDKEF